MEPPEWSDTCGVPSDEAPDGLAPLADHRFDKMDEWVMIGLLMRAKKSFNDIAEAMRYTHMIDMSETEDKSKVFFHDKPARRVTGMDVRDFGRNAAVHLFWREILPIFQNGLWPTPNGIEQQIDMFFYNAALWRRDHPNENVWEPAGDLQNGTGA
ncbi:MAG: hypothetical protein Q9193_004440 [Seirophora villosa]